MSGPQDPAGAGRARLRAGHADREQVIAALKDAFAHGRLTMGELDTRAGRALTARTYADLAALTADIPPAPTPAPVRPPALARRRPLARAAAGSGGCVAFAVAAVWFTANVLDPRGLGTPYHPWSSLCALVAFAALCAAVVILWLGAEASWKQRHPRSQAARPLAGPGTGARNLSLTREVPRLLEAHYPPLLHQRGERLRAERVSAGPAVA